MLYSVPKTGTPKGVPYLRGGTLIGEGALFAGGLMAKCKRE